MQVRAKMRCDSMESAIENGEPNGGTVRLNPVTSGSEENKQYEVAGAECINVVEGKTPDGDQVWIDNFDHDDPRVVTRVRVF